MAKFFGDSERKISEVDAFTLGLGMALGLVVGLVTIPLPGGLHFFTLGAAAGPLLVGMILAGWNAPGRSCGVAARGEPHTRQLGLMFFLAAVGLLLRAGVRLPSVHGSGGADRRDLHRRGRCVIGGDHRRRRSVGLSARAPRARSPVFGQPAILAYATGRANDERVEAGYSAVFAL